MVFPQPGRVFSIDGEAQFSDLALEIFRFQALNVPVYTEFIANLRIDPHTVTRKEDIPFLPIGFFKSHPVISKGRQAEIVFSSSGTTGAITSRHEVASVKLYEQSFMHAFSLFYGNVSEYCVFALLPAYLEREGSSLVYMADALIRESKHADSGFFLYDHQQLHAKLLRMRDAGQKTILIGVTFGLLDFAEQYTIDFPELIVMETGGMKGRRKEMIREELHERLTRALGVQRIHSEYGMTEMLSQAYSTGEGLFSCPPWMQIQLRDTNDPLSPVGYGQTGGINVIDLANIYSCSFIATQDLGKIYPEGTFEPLGRFDHSDIRGCNLMVL
ncbi:MAG: acyl transferase [Mucilaginibacter polytrichastri]|nr:acyl transferase [Mucilaginibacter polytrichastri]